LGSLTALAIGSWRWPSSARAMESVQLAVFYGITTEVITERPLAGVVITAGPYSTVSAEDGSWRLLAPPDTAWLTVNLAGYISMSLTELNGSLEAPSEIEIVLIPLNLSPDLAAAIDAKYLAGSGSGIHAPVAGADAVPAVTLPTQIRVLRNFPADPTTYDWMDLEEYVRGVVPYETPPSWHPETLRAQAIAARSYATSGPYHENADVCRTTHCQVYGNERYATTDEAVAATRRSVVTYNGAIANTFYFGYCIGRTRSSEEVNPNWHVPWCRSVPCDPCVGNGDYWGQGIGMCHEGAQGYASRSGWNYAQILTHYYTGISITPPQALEVPVTITSPLNGAHLRGVVLCTVALEGTPEYVDYYVNDQLAAHVTAAPWEMRLNTTTLADGSYTLKAVSWSGVAACESTVTIRVDNTPPSGTVTTPSGWLGTNVVPVSLTWSPDAVGVRFSCNWRWEAEDPAIRHHTGIIELDGAASGGKTLTGRAGTDLPGDWYGPYYCGLPLAPRYLACFRIKTPARYPNVPLTGLYVKDTAGQRRLGGRALTSEDLAVDNTYEEFVIPFDYSSANGTCSVPGALDGLEFVTNYLGQRTLSLDCITVFEPNLSLAPVVNYIMPAQEGEISLIIRLVDAAGNYAEFLRQVTVDLFPPTIAQLGADAALARDTVSGLDASRVWWADSTDGGETWSTWKPYSPAPFSNGTTEEVKLGPPNGAAADVRYMASDLAGHVAFTRGVNTNLPLVLRQC